MFCNQCGKALPHDSKFCLSCGHQLPMQYSDVSVAAAVGSGAVAARHAASVALAEPPSTEHETCPPVAPQRPYALAPEAVQNPPALQTDVYRVLQFLTAPRTAIREQLHQNPRRHVLFLSVLAGWSIIMARGAGNWGNPDPHPAAIVGVLLGALILGAILGPLRLYFNTWLTARTLLSYGGKADHASLRTALAWSELPTIASLPLTIPILMTGVAQAQATGGAAAIILICNLLCLAAAAWSTYLLVNTVEEVSGLSAWKCFMAALVVPIAGLILIWLASIVVVGIFIL